MDDLLDIELHDAGGAGDDAVAQPAREIGVVLEVEVVGCDGRRFLGIGGCAGAKGAEGEGDGGESCEYSVSTCGSSLYMTATGVGLSGGKSVRGG